MRQVLHPKGRLAVFGYGLMQVHGPIDTVVQYFYKEVTDAYWDPERKYLDDGYTTIPFPFKEEIVPTLHIKVSWTREQFLQYLNTWSAVKHFIEQEGSNPLDLIIDDVEKSWGSEEMLEFRFPLLLRVGRL